MVLASSWIAASLEITSSSSCHHGWIRGPAGETCDLASSLSTHHAISHRSQLHQATAEESAGEAFQGLQHHLVTLPDSDQHASGRLWQGSSSEEYSFGFWTQVMPEHDDQSGKGAEKDRADRRDWQSGGGWTAPFASNWPFVFFLAKLSHVDISWHIISHALIILIARIDRFD